MKAVALIREVEVGGTRGSEVGLGSGNSRAQEVRDAFRIMEIFVCLCLVFAGPCGVAGTKSLGLTSLSC